MITVRFFEGKGKGKGGAAPLGAPSPSPGQPDAVGLRYTPY